MGTREGSSPRSDRTRIDAPSSTARAAAVPSVSSASCSAAAASPWAAKKMGSVATRRSGLSLICARSACVRMGCGSSRRRACSGVSPSRFLSPPTQLTRLMTDDSRMGSIGGFVTWANCCLK